MTETSLDGSPYIFGHDYRSSIRLNYQHMLIKKLCDEQLLSPNVHQSIASRSSIRIADIATGTALWLTELSDVFPAHAELHGFDISSNQYPPQEWLPKNVFLHEHDAFKPFAPEYLGSFDVVNLRFFITLLNKENIQPLLSNLITLLSILLCFPFFISLFLFRSVTKTFWIEPGGFLQWLDFDPRSAGAIAIDPNLPMPRTQSVVTMIRKAQPDVNLWILHDAEPFEAAGLDTTAYKSIHLRNYLRPVWNHCHIMGMKELARRLSRDTTGGSDKLSPLLQQIKELEAEFAQGASIDAQWFMMIGRMPGAPR